MQTPFQSHIGLKLALLLLLVPLTLLAQRRSGDITADTLPTTVDSARLSRLNANAISRYFQNSDTIIAYQLDKVEAYSLAFNKVNGQLRRGLHLENIKAVLPQSDTLIRIAQTNLQGVSGRPSLKILYTTRDLLKNQLAEMAAWQDKLGEYNSALNAIKGQIQEVRQDKTLLTMPSDEALFKEYIKKLTPLGQKVADADSSVSAQLQELGLLQNAVSGNYLAASDLTEEAQFQINGFSSRLFQNEVGPLWNPVPAKTKKNKKEQKAHHFATVVEKSLAQSRTLLFYYSASNWPSRILVLLLGGLFYGWLRRNKKAILANNPDPTAVFAKTRHAAANTGLSAVVFMLVLIPFIYHAAPQIFTQSLWGLQVIALGFLLRRRLGFRLGTQIFVLLSLFYIVSFTNLLIEATQAERWIQLVVSAIATFLGSWIFFRQSENYFSRHRVFRPLVGVFAGMSAAAFIFNIAGRLTLAKVLNTGAIYGLIEAIVLVVAVEIIIDAIYLSIESGKKGSRLTAFFAFKGLEQQMRRILGIGAVVVWLVIVAQSLHIYDLVFGSLHDFLVQKRQLGNFTFTFESGAVFVGIIWGATLISQMISFIFGTREPEEGMAPQAANKLGSTMLLIRLAILSAGILFAFAASGIPIDKLAIVIGALGVGIGFGLQNIVNNLVSGVILAFEKPIRIGDLIDVGTRSGTVQEIGIRSSTITTFDGAEVIIPNGDLLSGQLINWTLKHTNRRVVLPVGVAYGTNLERVKSMVMDILNAQEHIQAYPPPTILVRAFGDNAVDFNVYFWADVSKYVDLKSDVYSAIYEALNREGISIPFPQRDLHIKSVDVPLFGGVPPVGKEEED
jgi:small-conductance mechanosensitive channel